MSCLLAKDVKTPPVERVNWWRVKAKMNIAVDWAATEVEAVPVVLATGLKIRSVDRFLQFARKHNPNLARYSATNDPKRGNPIQVL